jgi:hypothetical protein
MNGAITVVLVYLTILGLGLWGYVWNIVKLVGMCCDVSGMLLVRAAGIFLAPLGVVVGFL